MSNWKFTINLPKEEVIKLADKCSSEGYTVEYSIPCDTIIPLKWLTDKIDEAHNKLFELTSNKESFTLDEIRTFADLDCYAYTLERIYCDYTGLPYDVNHYMLRNGEKENEINRCG